MSFIAKNPLTMPEVELSPSVPQDGTRGIFAGGDGWYDIDSDSNTRKIATDEDIGSLADICQKKFATVHIAGGLDNWIRETIEDGDGNIIGFRYGQEVTVNDATITPCSKVDLQISSEQMVVFYEKSLAFVAENEDSVVTIYCVGGIPKNDYIVQAVVTEVATQTAKIVGNVVGLPNPQSDWEQKDKTKADYIKNKPDYENEFSNALKGSAAGVNTLRIDDVSPTKHTIALNVSRINLLPSPFAELDFLENGKNYTFSVKLKEDIELPSDYYYIFQGEMADGNTTDLFYLWTYDGNKFNEATYSFTVGEEYTTFRILYDKRLTADMFEYCQLEEGIVATEPTPYIEDLNDVTFYMYGKNLCDMTKIAVRTVDSMEYIDKNTVKWTGSFLFNIPVSIPAGTTFTWSYGDIEIEEGECKGLYGWYMTYEDDTLSAQHWNVYTSTAEKNVKGLKIYKHPTDQATITIHDIQIEIGEKATEYEPYKEPVEIIDINNVSIAGATTIISDTAGVNIETTYNKDINKVIADLTSAIISLGGNV